ncbi:MAG: hypothetical protein CM1200mP20_04280 [Pseudomonadota bacterium]|nr:MAG: hypothetical protein CM1200mP20_04280 [Pseudomonadota bacterium]
MVYPEHGKLEHVLGADQTTSSAVGIPIEQSNPEYAAGQVEGKIRMRGASAAAGRLPGLVKELGNAHGYHATFMSKPFFAESGTDFTCITRLADGKI